MNREVIFVPSATPEEWTFLLKDYETLNKLNPESHDIGSYNIITQYEYQPHILECYSLADFASLLWILCPKEAILQNPSEDNLDDNPLDPDE